MTYKNLEALVSAEWLYENLDAAELKVVDATWYLPNDGRRGIQTYHKSHIPGAVFFDIDKISDPDSDLPHMLPNAEQFASQVQKLGLGDDTNIVVYDANGGFMAACRVWWMLKVFGHKNVAILNGGLPKWLAEGLPIDNQITRPQELTFTAFKNTDMVRNVDQLIDNLEKCEELVVDVRSPGRFNGTEPEPRHSLRGGHIPGSVNIPIPIIMNPEEYFMLRSAEEIRANLSRAGLDFSRPVVTSCGSGVTACVVSFALYLLGYPKVAVYDGSWTEWGGRSDTPITLD